METTTAAPAAPGKTALGTPASPKWEAAWLAEVDRVETELGHRICGAHTPAWTPCKLTATHPNGRCRFHGGHPGIGAPDGNLNAWVHGLYSRRLQQCGNHCPLWNHCPMAGKDVLDLKPSERPHCVYEKEEYDAITFMLCDPTQTDPLPPVIARSEATKQSLPGAAAQVNPHAPYTCDPPEPTDAVLRASLSPREPMGLVEKNVALFQVMLTRAQSALSIARLTEDTRASTLTTNSRIQTTKVGALVQAQLYIARELRQWLKLLPQFDPGRRPASSVGKPSPSKPPKPPKPDPADSLPMRMLTLLEETEGALEAALGLEPGEKCAFSPKLHKRNPPPAPA